MSVVDERLAPGEMVVYRARLHWILFWKSLAVIGLLGILLRGHFAFVFVAAVLLGWQIVEYQVSEIFVTSRRVLFLKRELGGLREIEIPLSGVEEVTVSQNSFQARLDHGRIRIRGIGWKSGFSAVVCNPQDLERMIREETAKLSEDETPLPDMGKSEKRS
jgi:hypothetical protein